MPDRCWAWAGCPQGCCHPSPCSPPQPSPSRGAAPRCWCCTGRAAAALILPPLPAPGQGQRQTPTSCTLHSRYLLICSNSVTDPDLIPSCRCLAPSLTLPRVCLEGFEPAGEESSCVVKWQDRGGDGQREVWPFRKAANVFVTPNLS